MSKAFCAICALSIGLFGTAPSLALDMNVAVNGEEKLVYVNLWGEIIQGDDDKFRALILPYVRTGHLIWEVNIFSTGGNVPAAMGIGDQIRALQARTVTAYNEMRIINNQKVATGRTTCGFWEQRDKWVTPKFIIGQNWCTCVSACFLIWASGVTREGGHVGIHRLYWKGSDFGNLSPTEARARYQAVQANYTAYLQSLNVPQTIIDRLFATDSQSMYYLTWPEHELIQSTPYLEEMTYSRCGKSKTEHMSRANNWTSTEDVQHINCYRGILKEVMRDGVEKYLASLGEGTAQPRLSPAPERPETSRQRPRALPRP